MSTSCLPLQRASNESREGEGREGSVDEEEAEAGDEHSRVVRGSAEKKRKEVQHSVCRGVHVSRGPWPPDMSQAGGTIRACCWCTLPAPASALHNMSASNFAPPATPKP